MGIGSLNGISMSAAVGGFGQDNLVPIEELVAAIRAVNRGELEARGRVWKLRRGAGKPVIVELVQQDSGDVIDLLLPEEVVRMAAGLEKER